MFLLQLLLALLELLEALGLDLVTEGTVLELHALQESVLGPSLQVDVIVAGLKVLDVLGQVRGLVVVAGAVHLADPDVGGVSLAEEVGAEELVVVLNALHHLLGGQALVVGGQEAAPRVVVELLGGHGLVEVTLDDHVVLVPGEVPEITEANLGVDVVPPGGGGGGHGTQEGAHLGAASVDEVDTGHVEGLGVPAQLDGVLGHVVLLNQVVEDGTSLLAHVDVEVEPPTLLGAVGRAVLVAHQILVAAPLGQLLISVVEAPRGVVVGGETPGVQGKSVDADEGQPDTPVDGLPHVLLEVDQLDHLLVGDLSVELLVHPHVLALAETTAAGSGLVELGLLLDVARALGPAAILPLLPGGEGARGGAGHLADASDGVHRILLEGREGSGGHNS
eukprot:170990_1